MGKEKVSKDAKKHLPSLSIIVIYDMILGVITLLLAPADIVMMNVSLFSTKMSSMMVTVKHTLPPTTTPAFTLTVFVVVGL